MRIVTFNILYGGEDRLGDIYTLLSGLEPDVVALQECLNWNEGTLERAQTRLRMPYGVLGHARPRGSGRRYHVVLLSRTPIRSQRIYNDPQVQAHAAVVAELDRATVINTHLDAHDEDLRLAEARFLNTLLDPSQPMVLAGDLNSLSPRDPYPEDLERMLRYAGTEKYGLPPRYDVLSELEAAGWQDALYLGGAPDRWVTAERGRGGYRIDYRTDYVLVSPALASQVADCRVVATDASDHHAVVLDLFNKRSFP